MSPAEAPIIEARDLTKIYRMGEVDVQALRGVSLTVDPGEFVCVTGPSGSGKSTLFYVLGALMKPNSGSLLIAGHDLLRMTEAQRTKLRKKSMGFVFQNYNLMPALTAEQNIVLARSIAGFGDELSPEFHEVLAKLGIEGCLNRRPEALSGGEQQRVAIARAVVNHPALLLADEPTGNLDTDNSNAVLRLLQDLNRDYRQTILMISHDPHAASCAKRVVEMRDGRVVAEGLARKS